MTGMNLAETHILLDQALDRAIDLWDSDEREELFRTMDLIETLDRELYPEYWALRDKENEMVLDISRYVDPGVIPTGEITVDFTPARPLKDIQEYIVELGQQWKNEDTITIKVEGLIPLALDCKMIVDCTDDEMCDHGYIGQYEFTEGVYHVRCPEIRTL